MPSNGTKPFFLKSSAMDPNCGGLKSSLGAKMWKKSIGSKMSETESILSQMDNASRSSFSAPVILPREPPVLGLHLKEPETGHNQPTKTTFHGFQFQLPWAPHLSGINIGSPESTSTNGRPTTSKMNTLPFDYDMSFGSKSPRPSRPQSMANKLPSIQLASKCLNVIRREKKGSAPNTSPQMHFGVATFQSLSTCSKTPGKRTHAEMMTPRAEAEIPNRTSDVSSAKKRRFLRTADALQKSGLLAVTMESATLIQQNRRLQQEIEDLKRETLQFVRSVLSNPENKHLMSVSISS